MRNRKTPALLILAAALCASTLAVCARAANGPAEGTASTDAPNWWNADVWADPDRGFNWYPPDKPKKPTVKPATPSEPPAPPARPKNIREMSKLEDVRDELKRLHELAILQPSEKNVLEYLRAQEYVISQSAMFADVGRRVVWQNPEVDATSRHSLATYAGNSRRERVGQARKDAVTGLAKTHGLLFFFRSDCPYCHDMAPVIKAFSDQTGMQVIAVSMDGGSLPAFPRPRMDNGVSKFVTHGQGVQVVPALYLVSNEQKSVTLIGSGALAAEEVAERIRVLTTTKPGEEM